MIKFPRSMLMDIKNVRWQSNQGRRASAALRRLLNAPALPICLSSLGRPFHVWMGRTGTVRRVASSLHRRVFSTESEDARVVRSDTSARYSMRELRLSGASAWLISLWMRTQSLCWMIASNDNQLSCWRASVIWSYFRFLVTTRTAKFRTFSTRRRKKHVGEPRLANSTWHGVEPVSGLTLSWLTLKRCWRVFESWTGLRNSAARP